MAQSTNWVAATGVQTTVNTWSGVAVSIGANATVISGLRAQLAVAEAKQEGLRRDWTAARRQMLSAVTVFCGGSADKVTGFSLDVVSYSRIGALAAPTELAVNPGPVAGEVASKWARGLATHGFLVQHATDPTNAATVSQPVACTKRSFTLGGLTSGANVSLRVAAINPASPTGQSPWSAWVTGNAR